MEIWIADPNITKGIATTHAVENWVKHLPAHRLPPPGEGQIHGLKSYCNSPKQFCESYFASSGPCTFWNSEIDVLLSTSLRISDFDFFYPEFWRSVPIAHFMHCTVFMWKEFIQDRMCQVYQELADFIMATKIVVSSESHKQTILTEYKNLVSQEVLEEIEKKLEVRYYLIDYPTRLKTKFNYLKVPTQPTVLGISKFELNDSSLECMETITPDIVCESKQTDIPVFLWSQRLSSDKDPGKFCKLLKSLDASGVDFRLYITTGFSYNLKSYLKKYFSELWHKVGYVAVKPSDEIYSSILHSSDIWPSTAKVETFGISFMESMHCGVLPILPNTLCYPEMIPEEYHENFIYDHTDFQDFEKKTLNLITNRDKIQKKFDRSYLKKYSVPVVRDSWLDVLAKTRREFYSKERMQSSKTVQKVVNMIKENGRASKREIFEFLGWNKFDHWGYYRYQLSKHGFNLIPRGEEIYYQTPNYIETVVEVPKPVVKEEPKKEDSGIVTLFPRRRKFSFGP